MSTGTRPRGLSAAPAAVLALVSAASALSPDGFAVWSEGGRSRDGAYSRYLAKLDLQQGVAPNPGNKQQICAKGPDGGDIQSNISFDGKWVAFSRSLPGTSDGCGGNDYHSFDKWDVYIVRVDGSLPATPIRVDHGYWPSWANDSTGNPKTLYYSVYEGKLIKKATIWDNGTVGAPQLHYDVPTSEGDLHMMCSPDGQKVAFREGGTVKVILTANGNRTNMGGGCHPEWCTDSFWLMHATYYVWTRDGAFNKRYGSANDGLGQYHYGCSNDMKWVVTRNGGDSANNQNWGYPIWFFALDASKQGDSPHRWNMTKAHKATDYGNFPDIHVFTGPPPPPELTSIQVTPSSASINIGASQQFTAQPKDQYGNNFSATVGWNLSGGGNISPTSGNSTTFTSNGAAGSYTLTASSGSVSEQVPITVIDPSALHIKLDCGTNSPASGWTKGNDYVSGGSDFTFGGSPDTTGVANAAPPEVYHTCRHQAPSYNITAVPNGTYLLRIHFYDEAGGRSMRVVIEGQTKLNDYGFDTNTAVVKDIPDVQVSDGNGLQIVFSHTAGVDSFCSGIEIIASGGSGSDPVLTTIQVTPLSPTITGQGTQPFAASPKDQFGEPYTTTVGWAASGGGTVSPATGLSTTFISDGTEGTFTVTASAEGKQGSATVTVSGQPVEPEITVLAPQAGDIWYVGTTRFIKWAAVAVPQVVLDYSTDNGQNWTQITNEVRVDHRYWGSYPWLVPNIPSSQCVVKVTGYNGEDPTNSAAFEIRTITDGDGDGMDDAWETLIFGDTSHDKTTDTDGDGLTDYDEFMAGTDPKIANSSGTTVGFGCAPGRGATSPLLAWWFALGAVLAAGRSARGRCRPGKIEARRLSGLAGQGK